MRQLQFAEPEMDIRYVNNDSEGKVRSMHVIGFQTTGWAVNSNYDKDAHTITTLNKWRGVGDASSSGTYLFRNGDFSLVSMMSTHPMTVRRTRRRLSTTTPRPERWTGFQDRSIKAPWTTSS